MLSLTRAVALLYSFVVVQQCGLARGRRVHQIDPLWFVAVVLLLPIEAPAVVSAPSEMNGVGSDGVLCLGRQPHVSHRGVEDSQKKKGRLPDPGGCQCRLHMVLAPDRDAGPGLPLSDAGCYFGVRILSSASSRRCSALRFATGSSFSVASSAATCCSTRCTAGRFFGSS